MYSCCSEASLLGACRYWLLLRNGINLFDLNNSVETHQVLGWIIFVIYGCWP
jgi:hypothetical protein